MNHYYEYSIVHPRDFVFGGQNITLTDCQERAYSEITEWFDDPESKDFSLVGGAGTGKSFLVNLLCRAFRGSVAITAPTHKAAKVASTFTGRQAETLHSLLGLQPDSSLDGFDLNNIKFARRGKPTISHYALIVLDECSMVNDDLFTYLRQSTAPVMR